MNNGGVAILGLLAGAVIGFGAGWFLARDHYQGEVVRVVQNKTGDKKNTVIMKSDEKAPESKNDDPEIEKQKKLYKGIINSNSYDPYYKSKNTERPANTAPVEKKDKDIGPYILEDIDDYGEMYNGISLTYYKDGYVVDDDGQLVENPDGILGDNWREQFENSGESVLYIRNDSKQTDYEVLKVNDSFVDVYGGVS